MKLSICIPVYNFDVRELVFDLKNEIEKNRIEAEIILIDDASDESFKIMNAGLQDEVQKFVFLENNIGRTRIRNLFLDFAEGDYLLFLDCDGKVISNTFLLKYIQFITNNPKIGVVYGGRKVADSSPDDSHYLRWKFAVERENLNVNQRQEKPYLCFQTNNFIIKRKVLQEVPFNSEFQKYGYEDLLFAMELKEKGIMVDHIDNAIFNNDLEENSIYVGKVEESVESLAKMLKNTKLRSKLEEVKLVRVFNQIEKTPLKTVFMKLFQIKEAGLKKTLLKGNVSLRYLDLYKLGLLLKKMG
ncbi:glycosyltransferase family 2 protein [Chryseobacterium gwangjuense]|uniref:glycosyltransferase family 2 protein n=1 Tax=Chryseobacterium gwangjuense TaxID=1069980 RepID=UPI001E2C36FD|nr:glycosyltransferase [Chryseobacterium gwangjuense]MCE3075190.1 glycosyltransferase [Chryseobacterium gwangjuense]